MSIETIGVIGAGQMGSGIAHVVALAHYNVVIQDISSQQLDNAKNIIAASMDRQTKKKIITKLDRDAALKRISSSTNISALSACDMVVEAATEQETLKIEIFRALCSVLKEDAHIASNTSSISITRLAACTDRPERFIGMHFMNPVPVMKLVEIIRGIATSNETYDATMKIVERLKKIPAVSEDFPGFIVNRVLLPMINEAIYILHEGVGSVEAIDAGLKLGANHPMGPLTLADFIGLDTCLSIMQVLYDGLADSKYRPCPLLVKYVEAGWLGRKSNRGFYDYSGDKPIPTR